MKGTFQIRVDKELKNSFKSWCAKRGVSMTEVLKEAIQEKIKQTN